MYLTLIFTIVPSILIAFYIIFSDRFREPVLPVIYAFLLGFLIIIPAGLLNTILIFSNENPANFSFIAGFTEEPLKFILLYLFLRKQNEFNEPIDAIVYATLLSLGFATLENFEYVYLSDLEISSLLIAFIRAFTAIPLHACCGVVMGYYLGLYIFQGPKILLLKSICLPILIHSFYNYLCDVSLLVSLFYLVIIFLFAKSLLKKLKALQIKKDIEKEVKY